jgi:hypothetical protein
LDAGVLHACEGELLNLVKAVAEELGVALSVEREAYGEGGLESYLTFIGKHKAALTVIGATIMAVASGTAWLAYERPLKTQQIELNELHLRRAKLELKKLEQEAASEGQKAPETDASKALPFEPPQPTDVLPALLLRRKIRKPLSDFYDSLLMSPKVSGVGFACAHHPLPGQERQVLRSEFDQFLIRPSDLPPKHVSDAHIEVVAPVLRRDAGKWRGIFRSRRIYFVVNDQAFLSKVAVQEVTFRNGSTLVCELLVYVREDDSGEAQPYEYVVEHVHNVIALPVGADSAEFVEEDEGDRTYMASFETPAGRTDSSGLKPAGRDPGQEQLGLDFPE